MMFAGSRGVPLPSADRVPEEAEPVSEETRMGVVLLRLQAQAADFRKPEFNWVNRRVELMEFLDTRAVRRHVSVDFDVPADAPSILVGEQQFRLVPITNLPKGSLVAFDITDENGSALWLPTSDYSSKILASTVAYWAESILGTGSLTADLARIISGPTELGEEWAPFGAAGALIDAENRYGGASQMLSTISDWLLAFWSAGRRKRLTWRGFRQLRSLQRQWARAQASMNAATENLRKAQHDWGNTAPDKKSAVMTLMRVEGFRSQLEVLARNIVVLAAVTNPPKTRRIVKLTFEDRITYLPQKGLPRRLMQSAGWLCWPVEVPIGGSGGIHHLEAAAPPGVDIVRIIVTTWKDGRPVGRTSQPGGSPHVPVRVPADTPYRSQARILLRVSRPGWLTSAWLVALVIGAVMFAGRLRLSVMFYSPPGQSPSSSEAATAATLLLALLGVVAAVLARPGEHPLASRLLLLARVLILIDSAVVLSATGALVLHRPGAPETTALWTCLLVVTLVVAGLITASRFLPVMGTPRGISRLVATLPIRRR
jgi:hypothetical protein